MHPSPPQYDIPSPAPVPVLDQPVAVAMESAPRHLLQRRRLLGRSSYLAASMVAFRSALPVNHGGFDLLLSLVVITAAAGYCIVDARIRRQRIPYSAQWLLVFAWGFTIPAYLVWSGGKKGILRLILFLGTFTVALIAGAIVASLLPSPPPTP